MDQEDRIDIRKCDPRTLASFKAAAQARGRAYHQHLESLVHLHDKLRFVLDDPHAHPRGLDDIRKIVDELGLGSVTR